ncbi:hypothetical protein BT69DRAFT_1353219 [Atractiella rhizophila]|nr:hypothetical protein BT69DRAFT_1353219 [Atractiella rhizophila]
MIVDPISRTLLAELTWKQSTTEDGIAVAASFSKEVRNSLKRHEFALSVVKRMSVCATDSPTANKLSYLLELPLLSNVSISINLLLTTTQEAFFSLSYSPEPIGPQLSISQLPLAEEKKFRMETEESTLANAFCLNLHIFYKWVGTPFQLLPNELISMSLRSALTSVNLDDEENFFTIQRFRLVCKRFAMIGLSELFREIGGRTDENENLRSDKKINVLKVVKKYGEDFLPWIRKLHLKQREFPHGVSRWGTSMRLWTAATNLVSLHLEISPPDSLIRRKAILKSLASARSITHLSILQGPNHKHMRWTFDDVILLFKPSSPLVRSLRWLMMSGLDFRSPSLSIMQPGEYEISGSLETLIVSYCRGLTPAVLGIISSLYNTHLEKEHPEHIWRCEGFEPDSHVQQEIFRHSNVITTLRLDFYPTSPNEDDILPWTGMTFETPMDETIVACSHLRWLYLDGGHENSNLVSPHLLSSLFQPSLRAVFLYACGPVLPSSIIEYILNRNGELMIATENLWGDMERNQAELFRQVGEQLQNQKFKGRNYSINDLAVGDGRMMGVFKIGEVSWYDIEEGARTLARICW